MIKSCLFSAAITVCLVVACHAEADSSAVADPALSGWIDEILAENPDVQAAQAAVDAAGWRLRAADQPLFNPELEFDYENSEVDTTTGGISQTIDWADKRGAHTVVAESERAAAITELRARRQSLAADLLRSLADWHAADAIARVSEKQSELMMRFAHLTEQRQQAGDLGQVELDLAHLAAADAAFQQSNANENLIRTRQAVTALSGDTSSKWPALDGSLPDLDPRRLDVDHLLAELPELQATMARVAAARAAVQLSIREKRPDPTLGIRAGKEDSDTLIGITLSVPLYVRNSFRAEVDVANAEWLQAEQEAASLRQQARADLMAAAEVYRMAQRTWNNWEAAGAPRLSQRTELLGRLWQAGELNTTDYLVQLKQALETEVSATEQHGRMWRAWADWLSASGQVMRWLNLEGDTP